MIQKKLYVGLLCAVSLVPFAHAQTMSASGIQAVDSASGQSLASNIESLTRTVNSLVTQFAGVNTRLDSIDSRLDGIDARLDSVDTRLDGIDTRLNSLEGRMSTLETSVNTNTSDITNLNARITAIENNPPSTGDALMADMKVQVVSAMLCRRNDNASYTVKASCPAGYKLLSCSGGPGDLFEKYEGFDVRPLNDTTCEAIVKNPACFPSDAGKIALRTNLYAFCFKF